MIEDYVRARKKKLNLLQNVSKIRKLNDEKISSAKEIQDKISLTDVLFMIKTT